MPPLRQSESAKAGATGPRKQERDDDLRARINAGYAGKVAAERDRYRDALRRIRDADVPEAGWRIAREVLDG